MKCLICVNDEANMKTLYNDCIIESLEKIKYHYMNLKGKLCESELLTKSLSQENIKLKEIISDYKESEQCDPKKRRKASCEDQEEISFSQKCEEKPKSKNKPSDDLNTALNYEKEFEISFISNTPASHEKKKDITFRSPLKTLPVKSDHTENRQSNKKIVPKSIKSKDENTPEKSTLKKTSSWISKENELWKSTVGSVQKRPTRTLRHFKQENKSSNLSLKPGKLRQTRLQLDISRANVPNTFSDSTFCDEAIEDSPNADSSIKKINSSKQWQLRNISSKIIKAENDSILDFTNLSPEKSKPESPKEKQSETSSVVMLTPASQDIIFLDDSCDSFNIESMDLLKDLMNPTESRLSNLRRIESDGIKLLQKTSGEQVGSSVSKSSDSDEKSDLNNVFKTEFEFTIPLAVHKEDLLATQIDETPPEENLSRIIVKADSTVIKATSAKRTRIFDVDCTECQTYIKYLGDRLTDEEIAEHIRKCTNHKKRIEDNLTPEGFWDPIIRPFPDDDPRNLTLVDTRFVNLKK